MSAQTLNADDGHPTTSIPIGAVAFESADQVLNAYANGIVTRIEARLLLGLDHEGLALARSR